ncbi:Sec-independent protein translocase subunit TatA [Streptomyces sp. KLOTTS4A1]|uniref:Sec-independent protein translocase subunit TatA n=1 Tax=Streptomyces sp. KLOTTS4A1 TaxID=3390996 RepID=UPI0039F5822F
MGQVGIWQIAIIAGLILLLFGAKRLPDMARSLGKSARILKSEAAAMKGDSATREKTESGTAEQTSAPKTIQAAPGDVTSARPVDEPKHTPQG